MRQFISDSKKIGVRRAAASFAHRRHLQAVAWILMAAFVALNFGIERSHTAAQQRDLRAATYSVLLRSCENGNKLRRTLQQIILDPAARKQDRVLVREGRISQQDLSSIFKLQNKQAARVAPRPCKKAYRALKP
jgi:hypothetical protein